MSGVHPTRGKPLTLPERRALERAHRLVEMRWGGDQMTGPSHERVLSMCQSLIAHDLDVVEQSLRVEKARHRARARLTFLHGGVFVHIVTSERGPEDMGWMIERFHAAAQEAGGKLLLLLYMHGLLDGHTAPEGRPHRRAAHEALVPSERSRLVLFANPEQCERMAQEAWEDVGAGPPRLVIAPTREEALARVHPADVVEWSSALDTVDAILRGDDPPILLY